MEESHAIGIALHPWEKREDTASVVTTLFLCFFFVYRGRSRRRLVVVPDRARCVCARIRERVRDETILSAERDARGARRARRTDARSFL